MKHDVQKTRKKRILIIICFIFAVTLFIPTPFYLFQPGSVEELSSKVTVEEGEKAGQGHLYLTTVLSVKASNIYYLAYGLLAPHTDIQRSHVVKGDMSEKEYNRWLAYLMKSSQENAITAGLKAAGEEVQVVPKGMIVRNFSKNSKAKGIIEAGDLILKVDGRTIKATEDLLGYFKGKKAGEKVNVVFSRDGKKKEEQVELVLLPGKKSQPGIGVGLEEYVEVKPARKVNIQAGEIGGPSAGLMFSLEIYRQVTGEDITKGYKVAGTGTIDKAGNVGQIGGIAEKIAAVDKAGMDIFFCPMDVLQGDTNEKEVKAEVEKYGYDVKIVPVKTLDEAVNYLDRLPPKS
ncbi:SepM family pheromone-processing serine protease [Siminovitchia fortis]|uniref:endopeptidase La n=1 Tax=Siminovitchia fortis TaxID=254758 RepID=A0A451GBT8_9BACI|nr:SepM family pheromone-processing serine protease [Siminovitchia fortis]RWR12532.1 PDZ domain-containing protein [Siminovitchia fortis]WHY81623.1 SepM family pheromone-processing serine protease [Siminovitchia fortis]